MSMDAMAPAATDKMYIAIELGSSFIHNQNMIQMRIHQMNDATS